MDGNAQRIAPVMEPQAEPESLQLVCEERVILLRFAGRGLLLSTLLKWRAR
jgi:hypothetical protein